MARPLKKVPPLQVAKLAALGATVAEIADVLEVSDDTLERRFAGEIAKGRADLKIRLRRLQLKAAEKGNVAMLIFLGKSLLGQREDGRLQEPSKIEVIFEELDSPPKSHRQYSDNVRPGMP